MGTDERCYRRDICPPQQQQLQQEQKNQTKNMAINASRFLLAIYNLKDYSQ